MQKFGCPEQFTHMVRALYDGMMAHVMDDEVVSKIFAVTSGVKQGCVLAPALFSLMFSAMLMNAYHDERPGIRTNYRMDRHLLNIRCLQAPTRVFTTTVHDLLFVDDCALSITTEADRQRSMELFAAGCANFGLTINTDKTVVMHQPPLRDDCNAPLIKVSSPKRAELSAGFKLMCGIVMATDCARN
ncbi:unnamed protein product [Dibothriocephalus latus]|uniref:Reverse transcriptase domain-containing protein n=1 Tax=Dibothriocephalus latus TaxID=60516 RepID=A0A3P6P8E9_DIBLA|nr:unnamed protein product [Dibothriocephalus latus]